MKLAPMRYKGYEWRHNPREIKFECENSVKEFISPNDSVYIQDLGRKNRTVSGEGELCGADCMELFSELWELFEQGGAGILAVAGAEPIYAVFESLTLLGEPKPDIVTYGFLFREVMELKDRNIPKTVAAESGDTLWDISFEYGVAIDALVALNPTVKRPDFLDGGEVIFLC